MSASFAKSVAVAICFAMMLPATLFAQFGNGNNNNNGNGFFNQPAVGGVKIDANGVLSSVKGKVDPQIVKSLQSALDRDGTDFGEASKLRLVSLKGLERQVTEAANSGKSISTEARFLAGLQQITHVIASPKTGDILIAGPAEGLTVDAKGNIVGKESGRPPLRLDDLMVALQSVDNARTGDGVSVSINPTEQGTRNLRQVFSQIKRFDPAMQPHIEKAVGDQVVSLTGVPKDSHFAHVLVAADYKMKRISMGLEAAPVKNFPSLMEMAQQAKAKRMAASPRFWMECDYQPLAKSADNLVWQIRGSGVKTLTENDRYTEDGKAVRTGQQNRLAKKWADMMTERYDELADAEPVFRELQNLMDLSVAAAIIRKYDMASQVGAELPTMTGSTQTV